MDGEESQGGKRDGIAGTPPREYNYSMIYVSVRSVCWQMICDKDLRRAELETGCGIAALCVCRHATGKPDR
jgi:hypothetical protein